VDLTPFCPRFHLAVEIIGRRWTGAIVRAMLSGRTRFSDIREVIPGLSDRLLSRRLRELEAEGLVRRSVHAGSRGSRARRIAACISSSRELKPGSW